MTVDSEPFQAPKRLTIVLLDKTSPSNSIDETIRSLKYDAPPQNHTYMNMLFGAPTPISFSKSLEALYQIWHVYNTKAMTF